MTRLAFEGGWSLDLPGTFRRIERVGGLDATDGVRTIHVNSISLTRRSVGAGPPTPAREVHEARRPGQPAYELAGPESWGWALIIADQQGPHLQGTREAAGSVLTCWISYPTSSDQEWALTVWRSAHRSPGDS
jgi:hypothetical protein